MYNYNSDYSYGYSHITDANDTIFGMSIVFFLFFALITAIIGYVISSLLYMLIFKKAGIDTKKAWIPFYNKWIFFELGGQEGWKSLLAFIPYVGKSPYFAILFPFGILSFGLSSLVWFLILGLDSSRWNDIAGKESLAKGTILGYKIVEEEEASDAKEEKTEE